MPKVNYSKRILIFSLLFILSQWRRKQGGRKYPTPLNILTIYHKPQEELYSFRKKKEIYGGNKMRRESEERGKKKGYE